MGCLTEAWSDNMKIVAILSLALLGVVTAAPGKAVQQRGSIPWWWLWSAPAEPTADARPGSGNARPGSGNARPGSGNARPGIRNARPGSGNARPGSGGKAVQQRSLGLHFRDYYRGYGDGNEDPEAELPSAYGYSPYFLYQALRAYLARYYGLGLGGYSNDYKKSAEDEGLDSSDYGYAFYGCKTDQFGRFIHPACQLIYGNRGGFHY